MRVLGLDPGLTCAGYGLVEQTDGSVVAVDFGAIRTPPGPVPARLAQLYEEVGRLIEIHEPQAVAVERVLFNSNARTAMSVGQAAGVSLLAAIRAGCEVAEYTPTQVKRSITGDGRADKRQMQQMIARLLSLAAVPTPADAADALGLAITHVHGHRLGRLGVRA